LKATELKGTLKKGLVIYKLIQYVQDTMFVEETGYNGTK